MRKFKAWSLLFLMAFCVSVFSGCGGSLDGNTSETEETNKISSILTGTWVFDSSGGYSGYATNTESTSNRVVLAYSSGLKMVFSDFDFSGSSTGYEGSANLFYVHSCAVFSDNTQVGTVTIKSYSSSDDSDKTKPMTIKRVDDDEWILTPASGSSSIPTVTINVASNSKIDVQWSGTTYISALQGNYNYHISCSFIKTSSTPIYDDDEESEDEETTISDILKGTWLLHTEGTSTATNINTGDSLTLSMSTGNKISFFDFSEITSSGTGSADVFFSQNWLALDGNEIATGNFAIKSYSDDSSGERTQEMTLVKISDTEYRLGGKTGNSETVNVNITVASSNEISTQWSGIVYNSKLQGYYNYSVSCSFRKSSSTPTSDDITVADDETLEDVLEKTWKLSTQNNQVDVTFGENSGEMLLISSDITFSSVDINGDSGTAVISFSQNWRVFWTDANDVNHLEFAQLNLQDKVISMTRSGNNQWRCYFESSADNDEEKIILQGSVLNVQITSSSSIHVIHDGIVFMYSEDGNTYALIYNQNEIDYWEK